MAFKFGGSRAGLVEELHKFLCETHPELEWMRESMVPEGNVVRVTYSVVKRLSSNVAKKSVFIISRGVDGRLDVDVED